MNVHLAKGTRDILPAQMYQRMAAVDRLRTAFARFGFEPLETPAFERIETLTGKYGEEGQRLIFKILKRGEGEERGEVDQALRYDLTVPLARVIAMHPELRLPFKRWQIAPVWRADRPAKGRFREFWQCDADIVGTESYTADAECLAVADFALASLGFDKFSLRLNDRRVLRSFAHAVGAPESEGPLLVAIDKLDKIGREGVSAELAGRGFSAEQVARLWPILESRRDNDAGTLEALGAALRPRLTGDALAEAEAGLAALAEVRALAVALGVPERRLQVDPTLARGLDYYTGPVFEAVVDEPNVGSIAGGGRYDGLIGMFAGKRIPAVGISLGLERILTVMEELGWSLGAGDAPEVIALAMGTATRPAALAAAAAFRSGGVRTELFHGDTGLKNQLKFANARGIPWAVIVGSDEAKAGVVTLKDLRSGEQRTLSVPDAIAAVRAR